MLKVHGKSLWEIVTRNLELKNVATRFIYVCRSEDCEKHGLETEIKNNNPKHVVVRLNEVTDGAARSALKASHVIDPHAPLLIANSDQLFLSSLQDFFKATQKQDVDGLIMSMKASGNKWSYVDEHPEFKVSEVIEKIQISNTATVGLYYFKKASDFVEAAEMMIQKDIRTNNEFYLAPVYNELILMNKSIYHYSVGEHGRDVFGLGTAEDIENFHKQENSEAMIKRLFA